MVVFDTIADQIHDQLPQLLRAGLNGHRTAFFMEHHLIIRGNGLCGFKDFRQQGADADGGKGNFRFLGLQP